MKAVFEWSASDKLLREELIATGIAGKVNRYVEIDMQQLDTDTRRRIVALAGSISSDPLRIRSNEAIKPDAVASTRARGDNGLSRISLYFDQEPTMEEALVAAERFIAGMALVRVADRGYRAEKGIVALERIVDEARNLAYWFLETQRDKSVTRGGGWEARELTRLFVHFWESGRNAVQPTQSVLTEVGGQ